MCSLHSMHAGVAHVGVMHMRMLSERLQHACTCFPRDRACKHKRMKTHVTYAHVKWADSPHTHAHDVRRRFSSKHARQRSAMPCPTYSPGTWRCWNPPSPGWTRGIVGKLVQPLDKCACRRVFRTSSCSDRRRRRSEKVDLEFC